MKTFSVISAGERCDELLQVAKGFFPEPNGSHGAIDMLIAALTELRRQEEESSSSGSWSPDYAAAQASEVPLSPASTSEVVEFLLERVRDHVNYADPLVQVGVTPPPTTASLIGGLLAARSNANLLWDVVSPGVCEAEVQVASMCARLFGYDASRSAGVFTFGGTGTLLYGLKLGIEKSCAGTFSEGLPHERPAVIVSDVAHYASLNALGWLGLGTRQLHVIPTTGITPWIFGRWRKNSDLSTSPEPVSRRLWRQWEVPMRLALTI